MSAKARGSRAELKVKRDLEERGWLVVKAGGSLGPVDLLAVRAGKIRLIQVKSGGRSLFEGFPPRDRRELREAALRAGGEAWLVRCYPRKVPVWVPAHEWPDDRPVVRPVPKAA